jgi:D-alanyl-D-alanine carboxypeptidase
MLGRVAVLFGVLVAASAALASASEPSVTARAAIIVDTSSGETIWERNADASLPPASTTKVMTAILAIESGRPDQMLTVTSNASEVAPSKIGLRPGEKMALGDLLYAVLLNSANDAATVVAEGLAGSEESFATRMNARARALGTRGTHFVNPHGLTAEGHVSTARDLAKIFRHGLGLSEFREILETPRIKVPLESRRVSAVTLHSHNRLLTGYTHRVIGKTGYTRPAGRCFVGATSANGREIIVALLGSTDLWGDTRRLIAYAFGEQDAPSPLMVASRSRRGKAARAVVEGDDEEISTTRAGRHVHIANVDKSYRGSLADDDGDGQRHYTVRLGPYASRKEAEAARARLAKRGYRARVVGQAVMMGEFTSRGGADKMAKGLRAKGFRPTIAAR